MPDWKALVRARLTPLPLDPVREADIVDELAQHAADHCAELVAAGLPEADAVAAALAPLDDRGRVAAAISAADRPRRGAPVPPAASASLVAGIARDIRYSARLLRRSPAFTAAAVVALGLAIGANTTIFSVVNAVLLRPLPYAASDRLVAVGTRGADGSPGNSGYLTALDWRERTHAFAELAVIRSFTPTLAQNGEPERVNGLRVSANFLRMLGVTPALGRDFAESDDTAAGRRVVMLSDAVWHRRFGGDAAVLGRVISLNDEAFTIIGVMPASFEPLISERYYQRAELWAPVGYDRADRFACRSCQHLKVFGRLRDGVTIDAARADLEAVHTGLRREFPADYPTERVVVAPLRDELLGQVRPVLGVLMGAVGVVLLIACANVASLLLARMATREHDLALRAALGAGRGRLIRQVMIESLLLAALSGGLGIATSIVATPLLVRLAPASISRIAAAHLDARVLGFSLLLSCATALVFGLLPALRASRIDLHTSLHADNRKTGHAPTSMARRVLVAADVALAVVLLVAAGLMIKSVGQLLGVNPGFDPNGVLTMRISMLGAAYEKSGAVVATTEDIVARLRQLPGVQAAAAAGQIPLGGNGDRWGFHAEGRTSGADDPSVERYAVTPDYFAAMRIPVRRGRLFTPADRAGAPAVILIGEATARAVWPDEDPIGRRVRIGGNDGEWRTIVGIVGDVRHSELAAAPTMQMYVPQAQFADVYLTMVVRTAGDPAALAGEARQTIWSVARDVPVYEVTPLSELVARSVESRRFVMLLLEAFGAVALLMTAVGVYGVISYAVTERTREIGIRAALGASATDIVRLIVRSGMVVVAIGVAAGIAAALATTRLLQGSLYNVSASDPATFVVVSTVLLAVALLAQAVPIARALRVEPTVALRQE